MWGVDLGAGSAEEQVSPQADLEREGDVGRQVAARAPGPIGKVACVPGVKPAATAAIGGWLERQGRQALVNRSNGPRTRIVKRAERVGAQLRPEVVEAFAAYLDILAVWNRKMNLTALQDQDEAIDRLLLEPVMALRSVPNDATGFLDVGSGAGSPAIPMKICLPWMRAWLVESKVRKSAFLLEVVRRLGLDQVEVETCRFEDLAHREDLRRAVDLITIRAVRVDTKLWASLEGFAQIGASVFLFGGPTQRDRRTVPPTFEVRGDEHLLDANGSRLLRLRRV